MKKSNVRNYSFPWVLNMLNVHCFLRNKNLENFSNYYERGWACFYQVRSFWSSGLKEEHTVLLLSNEFNLHFLPGASNITGSQIILPLAFTSTLWRLLAMNIWSSLPEGFSLAKESAQSMCRTSQEYRGITLTEAALNKRWMRSQEINTQLSYSLIVIALRCANSILPPRVPPQDWALLYIWYMSW